MLFFNIFNPSNHKNILVKELLTIVKKKKVIFYSHVSFFLTLQFFFFFLSLPLCPLRFPHLYTLRLPLSHSDGLPRRSHRGSHSSRSPWPNPLKRNHQRMVANTQRVKKVRLSTAELFCGFVVVGVG